jgi:hypothetical protein
LETNINVIRSVQRGISQRTINKQKDKMNSVNSHDELANQTAKRPTNQLSNQSTNQPANQSINQLINSSTGSRYPDRVKMKMEGSKHAEMQKCRNAESRIANC